MTIKCPICGSEYSEGTVRFCKTCMYSLGSDPYLTDLLNHPTIEDLKTYNAGIEEFKTLWREKNPEKPKDFIGIPTQIETTLSPVTPGSLNSNEMVLVEGGTFQMGSSKGQSYEKPVHAVTVGSFLIGKFEVTQELWERVMGNNPSYSIESKRPVENVSWYDAIEFCNKLSEQEGLKKAYSRSGDNITCDLTADGYRLPTEAEWEYAAGGGNKSEGYKYPGSNDIDDIAWYWDNSSSTTHEVGTKSPNQLGVYDMSGNVREWCWDLYGDYPFSRQTNPKGAHSGSIRVLRGGGWGSGAKYCRVADRHYNSPDRRSYSLGFRLARTKV